MSYIHTLRSHVWDLCNHESCYNNFFKENGVFVEVEGPDSNNLGVMTYNSRLEPDKKKDLSGVNFAMVLTYFT